MTQQSHRRHDISDKLWELLKPHLPAGCGKVGSPCSDKRLFINAVFWILRTGASWRYLPPDLGGWKNTHRRFCRWRDRGVWEKLLVILIDESNYEWLMIDASHGKAHPDAAGARGGNSGYESHKRRLNSKIHLAVDAHGMPVRIAITEGARADCKEAFGLLDGSTAKALLADRGYDVDAIVAQAHQQGMEVIIAPKKNRKVQRGYD